jgi:chromosome partitioning protein
MQTIAVFALKGGVGKTAITVFLADFLSSLFKQRVLVVDLDPQQSSSIALLGEERWLAALERQASVGRLLMDSIEGKERSENVLSYATEREAVSDKGRFKYLQSVWVLASDREAWHDLDDTLNSMRAIQQAGSWQLLRKALATVRGKFDICLIDFPASYTGAITKNGVVAADWWLFPVEPNRMAARDVDGPRRLLRVVYQQTNRKLKGLGTVLSRCQNRSSKEYQRTRNVLTSEASKRHVPQLFSKDAEISFAVEALAALDDTLKADFRTIDQKYGGATKALHEDMRNLAREILERLRIPFHELGDVDTAQDVNPEVTKSYQMV